MVVYIVIATDQYTGEEIELLEGPDKEEMKEAAKAARMAFGSARVVRRVRKG
jgi:hypothetical protein